MIFGPHLVGGPVTFNVRPLSIEMMLAITVGSLMLFILGCLLSVWTVSVYGYMALIGLLVVAMLSLLFSPSELFGGLGALDAFGAFVLLALFGYFVTVHWVLGTKVTQLLSQGTLKQKLVADRKFHGRYKILYFSGYVLFALVLVLGILRYLHADFHGASI